MHVRLNDEPLEEVDSFQSLRSQVAADGGCERDVVHRLNERYRAWEGGGRRSNFTKGGGRSRSAERRKVNVLEMKCLRILSECHECLELGIMRCVGEWYRKGVG